MLAKDADRGFTKPVTTGSKLERVLLNFQGSSLGFVLTVHHTTPSRLLWEVGVARKDQESVGVNQWSFSHPE